MKDKIHWGLKTQMMLYGVLAVTFATLIIGWIDFQITEANARRELGEHIEEEAFALVAALEQSSGTRWQEILDRFHAQHLESGHLVLALNAGNRIVAASQRELIGRSLDEALASSDPSFAKIIAQDPPSIREGLTAQSVPVFLIAFSLHADRENPVRVTGALVLAEPYDQYSILFRQTFLQYLFSGLLLIALLVLPWWIFLERRILRPTRRIVRANRALAAGRREGIVIPEAEIPQGEIGDIMRSRQEMLTRLEGAHEELRQRLKELADLNATAALLELSQRLLAAKDEHAVAECAVDVAASALGTDFSALVLADADGRLLTRAVRGWPADFVGHFELGRGKGSLAGYTVLHGHPVAVENYATETAFTVPPVVFEHGIISALSVPMILAERVVGAMLVHSRQRRRFGDDEIRLLSLIGNQTAIALDKMHLLAAERQRADELDALRATTAQVLAEFELPSLFQTILARAVALLDATGGDLGLYEAASKELLIVASHNMGQDYTGTRMQLGEGAMGKVAETGEPLIVQDYEKWEGRSAQYAMVTLHAAMATPLLTGSRLVGVIGVVDDRPARRFADSDLRLLNLFAQQAALALERARMFDEERRTREAATALLEITQVAGSSLELRQVLKHIAQRTASACRANRCTIFLLDEVGEYLQPVMSQFADGHANLEQWQVFKATTADRVEVVPLFREAIRERRLGLLNDTAHTELIPPKWTQPFGIQKLLVVPLVSRDRAIGLMAIDHTDASREFSPEQVDLAQTVGGQVTSAIINARLYAQAARRTDQLRALHTAGRALTSDLSIEAVLQTLTESARRLVNARYAALSALGEGGQPAQFQTAGITAEERERIGNSPQGRGLLGAMRDGSSIRLADLTRDPRAVGFPPGHPPMKTFMGVPIVSHGSVIGSLYLTEKEGGQLFTEEDENLVVGLAADAAIAIENARLFEETQRLAVTDSLTGLHNRRYFFELAEREFQRARRYGRPVTAIMLDIDHFKRVNDAYNHAVGDEVLRAVAERSRKNLRDIDILGRYGGEEFVAILPETDLDGTRDVAERLRRCMAEVPIATTGGLVTVTLSLGIAISTEDCPNAAALINQADAGMYAAKSAGRNRVEVASREERPNAHR